MQSSTRRRGYIRLRKPLQCLLFYDVSSSFVQHTILYAKLSTQNLHHKQCACNCIMRLCLEWFISLRQFKYGIFFFVMNFSTIEIFFPFSGFSLMLRPKILPVAFNQSGNIDRVKQHAIMGEFHIYGILFFDDLRVHMKKKKKKNKENLKITFQRSHILNGNHI